MEKTIFQGKGFAVLEIDGKKKVSWAEGLIGKPVYYDITEENYSSLKLSAECTNVIVYIEGNDDLVEGSEYIHNIAPNAKVFLSRYGNSLEQKE